MGGNFAAFMKVVCKIVNHVARNSPNTLVEDLQKPSGPSGFIAKLNEDFQHQLEDYHFVNFFESNYTAGFDVVSHPGAGIRRPGDTSLLTTTRLWIKHQRQCSCLAPGKRSFQSMRITARSASFPRKTASTNK
jgi:hypothetical protein